MQGDEADALYVVQSGVITCDMDFLALSTRQHLQQVSKQVTADCTGLVQHRSADFAAWLLPLLWCAGWAPCQGVLGVPAYDMLGHMLNGSRQVTLLHRGWLSASGYLALHEHLIQSRESLVLLTCANVACRCWG